MILKSTDNKIDRLKDVITWAEGWYDREWMEETGYEQSPPSLRDKIAVLYSRKDFLLVVWKSQPSSAEYTALYMAWEKFIPEQPIEMDRRYLWEQWYIDKDGLNPIDGETYDNDFNYKEIWELMGIDSSEQSADNKVVDLDSRRIEPF